jgi:LacI family transcriptional regulator
MDILQVAKRAKVSTATVSRVLNGSALVRPTTSERVRKAIAELNYVRNPNARSLRLGRTHLVGLIVSDINNPFFPKLIDAFEGMAAEQGIDVIFMHTNYDTKRLQNCIRRMVERDVDGIAVMTSEMDEDALRQVPAGRVSVVMLNQPSLQDKYRNVAVEYEEGFREALQHLHSLGHREIGFIAGPSALSSARRRRQNWETAMKRLKLRVRPEWIIIGDMRVEGGANAMRDLLACKRRPTAVLATNDLMAVGALHAAIDAGLTVPKDVSLVGFDDLPVASMVMPPLTTIRLAPREIAAHAFEALLQGIKGGKQTSCATVYPKLVLRKSTGPAIVSW